MDTKEKELEAIKQISEQVKSFKESMETKAQKDEVDKLVEKIDTLSKNLGEWTDEKISKSIEEINKKNIDLFAQLTEVQENQAKQREQSEKDGNGEAVTKEAYDKMIKSVFGENLNSKTHGRPASMTIKAAETFGRGTSFVSGSDSSAILGRVIDPTLYQPSRKPNLVLDNFNIDTTTAPFLYYIEKVNISAVDDDDEGEAGGADWINCGEEKPKRSFRIKVTKVEAKKVAIFGTVEDCLLKDWPSFVNFLREDFMDEVYEEYNDALLNSDGTGKKPLGIKENASAFVATDAFDELVPTPTAIDSIIAAAAFMADNDEEPGKVFVSTDVLYSLFILKDTDGRYQNNNLVYVNNEGKLFIAGVEVVGVSSSDVSSAYLLMISKNLGFKILNYGNFEFEAGLNGTDFREDKTSYRGYLEVISYIPENREASVVYDTFANIKAAIASSATPVPPVPVTGISLNQATETVVIGKTEALIATIVPAGATNKNVLWVSSDETKATVSTNGLITGLAAGTTVITAVSADGNFTASCTVTVSAT